MKPRSTISGCCAAAALVIMMSGAGCGQNPLAQLPSVVVKFQTPADTVAVRDDQTIPVKFTVALDHPMTARVELDRDETPGNGNETQIAADQTFDAPGGEGSVDFMAGQFPYGTYHLRVVMSDAAESFAFATAGPVYVVPVVDDGASNRGFEMMSLVEGMRLLHTNGNPSTVNSRAPFLATWNIPDVTDNLSPVFISPVQIDKTITVRRMQFYTFGHTGAQSKRLEIYAGTSADSPGTLIQRMDLLMTSSATGGWNMATVSPPITLPPGNYGVSFHGCCEFSENWGANATKGPGFALISTVEGAPFVSFTQADVGFSPNFTMRMLGTLPDDDSDTTTSRAIVPVNPPTAPPPASTYPDDNKPQEGLCDKEDGDEDREGRTTPFHVTWQVMKRGN